MFEITLQFHQLWCYTVQSCMASPAALVCVPCALLDVTGCYAVCAIYAVCVLCMLCLCSVRFQTSTPLARRELAASAALTWQPSVWRHSATPPPPTRRCRCTTASRSGGCWTMAGSYQSCHACLARSNALMAYAGCCTVALQCGEASVGCWRALPQSCRAWMAQTDATGVQQ